MTTEHLIQICFENLKSLTLKKAILNMNIKRVRPFVHLTDVRQPTNRSDAFKYLSVHSRSVPLGQTDIALIKN